MKRYPIVQTRKEYEAIQRDRTQAKWDINGITRVEVEWIRDHIKPSTPESIICLGVRNGLEVDLFREMFAPCHVQGVELHPQGSRADVWIGSFDAMPVEWESRFDLLYSNALDHAYDPKATALEWSRVAKPGAILALALDPDKEPTASDLIAQITVEDLMAWFGGSCLLAQLSLSRPRRVLWRLP